MAPSSEYTASGGGRLKIKGAKVQDGRVDKKKKKKKPRPVESEEQTPAEATPVTDAGSGIEHPENESGERRSRSVSASARDTLPEPPKTEAEKRHEEARRKRLNERLKREGIKTHKERVEELNKYLSNLSEHHDMCVLAFFTSIFFWVATIWNHTRAIPFIGCYTY
ncbi:hypothetical protein FQN57_003111 [Myotisia sp. PD_48]|nr:hypothetical protein FQN57_003111 [Myotisia sp. PD_48]